MSKKKFQRFKKGSVIRADGSPGLNELQESIERLDQGYPSSGYVDNSTFSAGRPEMPPRIKFVRMTEVLGPRKDTASQWFDKDGVVQTYQSNNADFADTSEAPTNVTAHYENDSGDIEGHYIADVDDIVPCVSHNGKLVPISGVSVRTARTVKSSGQYPNASSVVFPIKFVRATYSEALNITGYSTSDLDTSSSEPDDWVCNLYDGPGNVYIPEGAIIWVYKLNGQWFTFTCCELDGTSESSISVSMSSQSDSSASSGSSSQSSVSESSLSSTSESSLSSLSSSLSSLSSLSSESSVSSVSGSESSVSVSESSSGFDCIDVVTSFSFDSNTCEFTWCTRQICFPTGLGITIGPEVCS